MTENTARLSSALADRYKILDRLGEGGMATVYLAEDLKHDRKVAVKVLRPELAAVLGADRFVQEIKTTANLQHPHILPLFDSGEADSFLYYVMPFIDGETLRAKLDRETQLGIDEAVTITANVADALDYAHRQGVIHRDIKPENILLHDGRPMVADFGIALALSAAAGGRMTETGLSLGTPHYMSPEQATAEKELTKRSDIYSLGAMLYEMLTGDPPHTGSSAQQIIMKIVTDVARPLSELRKSVPPNVAAATAKALEKLPADRFESASAFAAALGDERFRARGSTMVQSVGERSGRPSPAMAALVGALMVATVASLWGWLRAAGPSASPPAVEFYIDPPESNLRYGHDSWGYGSTPPLLSPDGTRIVAAFVSEDGTALYQRSLDDRQWRFIPGTDGAQRPFFSPDGQWLGFVVFPDRRNGRLMKIPIDGGRPQMISDVGDAVFGATWTTHDSVVFSSVATEAHSAVPSLLIVSVDGGTPTILANPADSDSLGVQFDPYYVAEGNLVLFTEWTVEGPFIAVMSLDDRAIKRLTAGNSPKAGGPGQILYANIVGTLWLQSFDPGAMGLRGEPVVVRQGVTVAWPAHAAYTASLNGTVAFLEAAAQRDDLVLVDRAGTVRSIASAARITQPRFSVSGDRIAFVRGGDAALLGDIWVYTFSQGTALRLTSWGHAGDPVFTPDGGIIGYWARDGASPMQLFAQSSDGTGDPRRLRTSQDNDVQLDFEPDNRSYVFLSQGDLYRGSIDGAAEPTRLTDSEFVEEHPDLSPDGRWLAYKSNETGIDEIYVRRYPEMGPRTLVSLEGGIAPAWSSDGTELFYLSNGSMTSATLRLDGATAAVVERHKLFPDREFRRNPNRNYDVRRGGQEFVMVRGEDPRAVVRVNALEGGP